MKKQQIRKKKVRRDLLLSLINNRQTKKIDLSKYSLTGTDFSGIELRNITFSNFHDGKLTDLSNAKFRDCVLIDCKFSGAIFNGTTFRGSKLEWCDFRYAKFKQTTFQNAEIDGCDFYRSEFEGNNIFEEARLRSVSLNAADLQGAGIRKNNLSSKILQEDETSFRKFQEHYKNVSEEDMNIYLKKRFYEAMLVYRSLMGLWTSKGFLKDAGWAYVKSKRMEKKTFAPSRANVIYGSNYESKERYTSWKNFLIRMKYIPKFISYWFVDIFSGFGESLSRVIFSILVVLFTVTLVNLNMHGVVDIDGNIKTHFIDNLLFSLGNLTSSAYGRLIPANQFVEFINAAQSLIGIALIGLLGFILGNKIRNS